MTKNNHETNGGTRFPTCYVVIPEIGNKTESAAFYLAAEEYIARQLPENNYLFSWQLAPTVVIGRNQVAHQEINIDFCRRNHIEIVRRKSGGGSIFANDQNIMWSLITTDGGVEELFSDYACSVASALKRLGVEATVSGRNDIVLPDGCKVCGNAFYHLGNRNIVHGTMLYDTDLEMMSGALNPDVEKLKSAGVKSVRSRVGFLKDYLPFDVMQLRNKLHALLCDRSLELTEKDVTAIREIEQGYYDPVYLQGRIPNESEQFSQRIEGCGRISIGIALKGSVISGVSLSGDYFEQGDTQAAFAQALCGVTFTKEALREALLCHHPERTVRGLSEEALLHLLEV